MNENNNGLISLRSRHSVAETAARLERVIDERGLRLFARIDHAAAAAEAGLKMRAARVYVFGNPAGGTALMIAAPTLAIDLPFKALIWEDAQGAVWLSYNAPDWLAQRHQLEYPLSERLLGFASLLKEVAEGMPATAATPRRR